MKTRWLTTLLPQSLVGRVFALYTAALLCFVGGAVAIFYHHQFHLELERTQLRTEAQMEVVAPTVADNAVIGDYDTIQRTLERSLRHSDFARAVFIDLHGGAITATRSDLPETTAPGWLETLVADHLYDANQPISVGGRDYGVLRWTYATDRIAGGLWVQARATLLMAAAGLACGLLIIWWPLQQWLGNIGRIESLEEGMRAGLVENPTALGDDAPIEFRRTFDVLSRAAADMRLQREQAAAAIASLRGVLEGLVPQAHERGDMDHDIEAISLMISQVTEKLQAHGAQLGAIFDLSPDGFISFDPQGIVTYVSPAFTRLTGIDTSEVLGLDEDQFTRRLEVQCGARQEPLSIQAFRRDGDETDGVHHLQIERPTWRTLGVTLRRGDGKAISQILHLRDVTHETEVDQMKSEFLSMAAHELRTPMSSIYGFTELMMTRPMTPERQKEMLAAVHRQAVLIISIVNELLDLARIEARRGKDFVIQPLDLMMLVQDLVRDFTPPGERPAPRVRLEGGPVVVRADRGKLLQALSNVLSNAYKYSPSGGAVDIMLGVADGQAWVKVVDHGIGMTPQQLERMGERFFRADASGSIPGTGLGVSIVKEIVALLGGRLAFASEPGQGTTVTIWLAATVMPSQTVLDAA